MTLGERGVVPVVKLDVARIERGFVTGPHDIFAELAKKNNTTLIPFLRALKRYGLIVADNGSSWYLTGAPDPRFNDEDLEQLKRVPGSAFQAVQSGPIRHRGPVSSRASASEDEASCSTRSVATTSCTSGTDSSPPPDKRAERSTVCSSSFGAST